MKLMSVKLIKKTPASRRGGGAAKHIGSIHASYPAAPGSILDIAELIDCSALLREWKVLGLVQLID